MADTVTSQIISDGARITVMRFTNTSDGTGEAAVVKVNPTTLFRAPNFVKVYRIAYSTKGMGVRILWDATTPTLLVEFPANYSDEKDYGMLGVPNPKAAGFTGSIKFTTVGAAANASYSIQMWMNKAW
jgi:hypothetical protein